MTTRTLMPEPAYPLGPPIQKTPVAPKKPEPTWSKADTPGYSRSSDGQMRRDDFPVKFEPTAEAAPSVVNDSLTAAADWYAAVS